MFAVTGCAPTIILHHSRTILKHRLLDSTRCHLWPFHIRFPLAGGNFYAGPAESSLFLLAAAHSEKQMWGQSIPLIAFAFFVHSSNDCCFSLSFLSMRQTQMCVCVCESFHVVCVCKGSHMARSNNVFQPNINDDLVFTKGTITRTLAIADIVLQVEMSHHPTSLVVWMF